MTDIQEAGMTKAKDLDPNATTHVERVRDVGAGRDKWRKIK